ncbi:SNF7 family protein [Plasmodium cynomolgi strain B]|uniref:SNF7 family protein n=1 Tax=Plasmodium cynomolgi (strain B) TaxID=1120755 RepID=K6UQN3_PLACD|nr:SNF7 family protein [Plasmodium cynomolgi strain B]GAB65239.1 SNF7 family protein [Plasmodium cynomolgi strain B]
MGGYFSKDLEECLRNEKRNLNRSIRELEREIFKLTKEQNRIEKDIKINSKRNDNISMIKLQSVKSSEQLGRSLTEINRVIKRVNGYIKLSSLNKSINEYQKENTEVSLKEDMLDDLFETFDYDSEMVAEEDELVTKVLEGMGIQMNAKLDDIPTPGELPKTHVDHVGVADLEARLNNLRLGKP